MALHYCKAIIYIHIYLLNKFSSRVAKRGNKILYSTLYANNGDQSTRDKQLTRDMLYRLLDEVFKETGYVTSYKEDSSTTPGVILTINTGGLPEQKK